MIRLFIILCLFLAPLDLGAKEVIIRLGQQEQANRLVVALPEKTPYQAFSLANPARLVIDLAGVDWQFTLEGDKKLIDKYRSGAFQRGQTRLVIDMKQDFMVKKSFVLDEGTSYRLVIDFVKK